MVPAQLDLPIRRVLIFRLKTAIFDLGMLGFESLRLPAFLFVKHAIWVQLWYNIAIRRKLAT
jgi:hypothetical protein